MLQVVKAEHGLVAEDNNRKEKEKEKEKEEESGSEQGC